MKIIEISIHKLSCVLDQVNVKNYESALKREFGDFDEVKIVEVGATDAGRIFEGYYSVNDSDGVQLGPAYIARVRDVYENCKGN